jgi:integrase
MPSVSTNRLTAKAVETTTFSVKPRKLFDGDGLFLLVNQAGRYWRMKYRLDGKEKLLALGVYPEVSLKDARKGRDAARQLVAKGIDPVTRKQALKETRSVVLNNTLENVAREWHQRVHQHSVTPKHADDCLRRMENHLFPALGHRPISEITAKELLDLLQGIASAGKVEMAHRIKALCGQIWRYGIPTGLTERDIAADLRDCLRPAKVKHHPAITDPKQLGDLLRSIYGYEGFPEPTAALKLSAILFVRPGELRHMEWTSLDLENATWHFQPSKGGAPMLFPLSRQAVEILQRVQVLTGHRRYVFPSGWGGDRPISENTINAALIRLGYKDKHTAHGFRATARTILAEVLGYPIEVIEMQLAHAVKDANGRAYNRTTYLEQRREMMQAWADYLDELRKVPCSVPA